MLPPARPRVGGAGLVCVPDRVGAGVGPASERPPGRRGPLFLSRVHALRGGVRARVGAAVPSATANGGRRSHFDGHFLATATVYQSSILARRHIIVDSRGRHYADCIPSNSNLSVALLVAGRGEAAIPYLEASIGLEPRDAEGAREPGLDAIAKASTPRRYAFEEAVALRANAPAFASARYNLGILLVRAGRKHDGLAHSARPCVRSVFGKAPAA